MDQGTSKERLDDLRQTLEQIRSDPVSDALHEEVLLALEQLDDLEGHIRSDHDKRFKFISLVSHELRLPMTSILGYTDLLRKGVVGPVNDQQLSFLNVIRSSVERMATLIADLSDLNKMEAGRLKLSSTELSLVPYLRELVRNLQPKFIEKKQVFEVEIQDCMPAVIADPDRLTRVLATLLNNASMYTPEGGLVWLAARLEGGQVRIEVTDTGIGISQEDQSRLFQLFFRSEDAYVREQQGWGLGLSVVKGFVELMGGMVGAVSQPGTGSTFWLTLPINGNSREVKADEEP